MHPDEIKRAPDDEGQRLQYVQLLTEAFEGSRSAHSPVYQKCGRLYDAYRAVRRRPTSPNWNDVAVPLAFSTVQSMAARLAGMLFGGDVQFLPSGPEDTATARRVEKLVNLQLYDARTYQKGVRMLLSGGIVGTQPYMYSWRQEEGNTYRRVSTYEGTKTIRVPNAKTDNLALRFNGPWWEPIPVFNFFPWPGFVDIEDMPGVVVREYIELEDLVIGSAPGPDGRPPVWDKKGVDELRVSSPRRDINDERLWVARQGQGVDDLTWERMSSMSKPVEVLHYWGRVPRSMGALGPDGRWVTEFVISVADRKHLIRAEPSPFWHIGKPVGAYRPFEDPYYFWAPSAIELIEKLQAGINKLTNSRLDVLDLFIAPPWLFNMNGVVDTRRLKSGPGVLVPVNGPVDDSMIRQLVPDLRGVNVSYQEVAQLWQHVQQVTGVVEDITMGMGTSDRQTAREFIGRKEAVSTRLAMAARLAEVQWIEPLARAFCDMDRQFLPLPQQIRLIGASAVWDPVMGRFIPPDAAVVTGEDLLPEYDVRATGLSRTVGEAAQAQGLVSAVQVLGSLPPVAATINWLALVRQLLPKLSVTNVDEVMNTEQQMQQALVMFQGTRGAPAAPALSALLPGMEGMMSNG